MASNRSMSTEEIKRGLQNIKRAQLEVLKQLRGDSFIADSKPTNNQSMSNIRYNQSHELGNNDNNNNGYRETTEQRDQNRENIKVNINRTNKSQVTMTNKYERNFEIKKYESSSLNQNLQISNRKSSQSNQKLIRANESMTQASVSGQSYQTLRRQFSSERQELKRKLAEISSKLNQLEKQSQVKSLPRVQQVQLTKQVKKLQQQKKHLQHLLNSSKKQIQQFTKTQKKLNSELQLRNKQKIILQTQIKSLKSQTIKQYHSIKQLQKQISKYIHTIKELKQQAIRIQQSRINMDVVMRQVKSISGNHDFMFNKLKQSTTIDMSIVEKESDIQNCFSRLLDYFENMSSSGSGGYSEVNYDKNQEEGLNNGGFYRNNNNNKKSSANQSRQLIKKSIISQSRAQDQDELEYFVREMGGNITKKQANQLIEQNQSLKKRLHSLTQQKTNASIIYRNDLNAKLYDHNGKYQSESKRLINLQLQDMREQVAKFKKFKHQIKQGHQQLQKQSIKYKLKAKDLQAKLQSTERKLTQATNTKFQLQKKTQQQSLQIISLNAIIKEFNTKLYNNNEGDSPLSQLRNQFNKLLETNSLIQRQNNSLKAMNQGLQAQIQTLKYEKDQYQTNNKQKHELIQRQIQQRNHLLQEINKAAQKHKSSQQEIDKLKTTIQMNQQQTLKVRKHYQGLLQQRNQEVLTLRKQIEQLYKQSREYHQIRFGFDKLQKQHKELARKSVKMGETLTHLWSVKEAEYHNINLVLGMLKNNQSLNQQSSAHF